MLKSKLIIAGSNFIFEHINSNYQNFLKPKNKLMVIFRGINLDYFNPQNISEKKLNQIKLKKKKTNQKKKSINQKLQINKKNTKQNI